MLVDSIPVATTPPGGWTGAFPEPVLATCDDPLVPGAPDMRGMWQYVGFTCRLVRLGPPEMQPA